MTPEHYSRDIVSRCESLIRHLTPLVAKGLPDDQKFGGPLRTTFLLAMATPMVILPIERIFKPATRTVAADDRELDQGLAAQVADVLGHGKAFGAAPFSSTSVWAYAPNYALFNAADDWPAGLLDSLGTSDATARAKEADAMRILLDLRNALAHGGVVYLDQNGKNTDREVAMLAFVGTKMERGKVVALNILRVSEDDFRAFLSAWADWLTMSGVAKAISDAAV